MTPTGPAILELLTAFADPRSGAVPLGALRHLLCEVRTPSSLSKQEATDLMRMTGLVPASLTPEEAIDVVSRMPSDRGDGFDPHRLVELMTVPGVIGASTLPSAPKHATAATAAVSSGSSSMTASAPTPATRDAATEIRLAIQPPPPAPLMYDPGVGMTRPAATVGAGTAPPRATTFV